MKILVSGSQGLIGTRLCIQLEKESHQVFKLTRSKSEDARHIYWQPSQNQIDNEKIEGFDAVIHLGGINIAEKRWTASFKNELRLSRVQSTALIAKTLATLKEPPRVFICASAVGYYGDRNAEILDENSTAGSGFLPEMAQAWEAACLPAAAAGIRLVHARFGIVLDKNGGALAKMLPPFRLGLGGRLGSGKHYISWISLEDVINALRFIINTDELNGAVNITAPAPVTNSEFTKALARALHRPALFPAPRSILRIIFGEMVDEALFCSARVVPKKLMEHGFKFADNTIDVALSKIL